MATITLRTLLIRVFSCVISFSVARSDLDAAVAQAFQRISGSIDDVAGIIRRDTDSIALRLNRGTDTLVARDRLNIRDPSTDLVGSRDYIERFLPRWIQPPVPRVHNAPELIADELERIHRSGAKARWANYDPELFRQGHRGYEGWLKSDEPLGPLNDRYGLNCWEMICYAAARTGVVDKPYLRELTELPRDPDGGWSEPFLMKAWLPRMGNWLIPEGRRVYTGAADGPAPQRGDIVMWNRDAEHVTMATGRTGKDGSPELYSFWYLPKYDLRYDEVTKSYSQVVDAVQVTTIKELTDSMLAMRNADGSLYHKPGTTFDVTFGRGPW